jgi:hypothetical protein
MADEPQFLTSEFERIALGDQNHAAAVDALRGARDKPYVLIVENDNEKHSLFSGIPNAEDGHALNRLAERLHQVAVYFGQMALNLNFSFMASQFMKDVEEDDAGNND